MLQKFWCSVYQYSWSFPSNLFYSLAFTSFLPCVMSILEEELLHAFEWCHRKWWNCLLFLTTSVWRTPLLLRGFYCRTIICSPMHYNCKKDFRSKILPVMPCCRNIYIKLNQSLLSWILVWTGRFIYTTTLNALIKIYCIGWEPV